ncbi:MAG: hypothetical protein PF440_04075 [Thiomicrorhabdus sp.]|jgi:hypothetical protein|nr:hypothetical protein [Thiomicrorhabdus sp.]
MIEDDSPTDTNATHKFTDWKKEPTVRDLKQNITDGEIDQQTHASNVARWMENMAITGSAKLPKVKGRSNVAPKIIRKQAEWRYSSLTDPFLSTPDLFNVTPITAGDRERAKQNSLVLNNQFNTKLGKVYFIDEYIREAVDIGTVIVKVGWDTETEKIVESNPTFKFTYSNDPELQKRYMVMAQVYQSDPEKHANYATPALDKALEMFMDTGQTFLVEQTGEEEVKKTVETKNQPTVEIMNSENIIIDPSCNGRVERASFWGEKFKASLSDLKKDGKYSNLDAINTEGESTVTDPDYADSRDINTFAFTDKPRKQFVVHNYWGTWDIYGDGTTHQIVASWVGDVMIRLELNPYPDKKPPFVKAVYMPVRRSVFGEPDGELLEDNQKIIGAVTRGMVDLMGRSANGQTGMEKGFLDVTNQRKFKAGADYEFNSTRDPRQSVYAHTYPEIPKSAYNMITMQNADAESLTGVKAYYSGIGGQSLGDVATGVRGALDAASKRELGILRRLAAGVTEVGKKIISMNAVFLSEEETVRITDDDFVQVRRDDLAGNFDLSLTISTAEEDNKKAEELAFMLQTMGNNMDPVLSKMILGDIARLRKMPDMAKRIEEYEPQPDPLEQMEAQLKITFLEAQIAKEKALAMKHQAEAQLSGARADKETTQSDLNIDKGETERAKAKLMGSDADNKDLDFVEQESGVAHARDIDKIDTKSMNDAVSQMGLKDMDAENNQLEATGTQ